MDFVVFRFKKLLLSSFQLSEDISCKALQKLATFAGKEVAPFRLTGACPPSSKFKRFFPVTR
jgi:hypothetical protein